MIGSPHSPTGNGGSSTSCPQYPDAMALAGQNYQHFMDLTKDVQKLSVVSKPSYFLDLSNFFFCLEVPQHQLSHLLLYKLPFYQIIQITLLKDRYA